MDAVYRPTNREKARTAVKGHRDVCGCDRAEVGQWGKCPVCGYRNNPRKIRIKEP